MTANALNSHVSGVSEPSVYLQNAGKPVNAQIKRQIPMQTASKTAAHPNSSFGESDISELLSTSETDTFVVKSDHLHNFREQTDLPSDEDRRDTRFESQED